MLPELLAIDPGSTQSGYVLYDVGNKILLDKGKVDNEILRQLIKTNPRFKVPLLIEQIASYGMPVGAEVFTTCIWTGRFIEAHGGQHALIPRLKVKVEICHNSKANDSNIRRALLDLHPATGGGAVPQVGTTAKPGPLFGVSKDIWAALGVALTGVALDNRQELDWQLGLN